MRVVLLAAVLVAATMPGVSQEALGAVLRRAAAYAETYHRDFTSIVAEEHYVQRVARRSGSPGTHRTLRSDFMLLRGEPGQAAWISFRDIFEVDGRPVSGERGRLERWLHDSRESFASRARALAFDQARYNIGDIVRTINVPLLPLEFLIQDNQRRMRFRLHGNDGFHTRDTIIVAYEERRRPTIIRTPDGANVPASGRVWIERASGRVYQTELRTGERDTRLVRTTITVSYEPNERLNMLVPVAMEETYVTDRETITGSARYSNYRRFETEVRIK